jgi:membrane protease YdiL (CAAX protease family)
VLKNPRVKLGAALWAAGMVGVIVLSVTVIPQLLAEAPQNVPVSLAIAASLLQSGVLLALAVWAGVGLSKPLGLGAPVFEAVISRTGAMRTLSRQLLPAVIAGLLVAVFLVYFTSSAPAELAALGAKFQIPLAPKLLYGGITEEILMRWGLMTAFIWLLWRFLQRREGLPRTTYVAVGTVVSALLFGLGHLPAVGAMGAELNASVVTYVVVGNTVPGVIFGVFYWRWGLEAAMLAHALAHAASTLALYAGIAG